MSGQSEQNPVRSPDARRHCILGTAGHIDHGKSALVRALTGTDPDRLPEERIRGMTIVLGFAQLSLPDPDTPTETIQVGIVDVPGHERFVRMMVAGATGIDVGMLVVAADDGVMPQTREHVEILSLLGVDSGLIVVNKADLAHPDRIDAVHQEIRSLVENTTLRNWPMVAASAKTGEGLDEIRATIAALVAGLRQRTTSSIFRLAIDRVFSIKGRGTVVTGSVLAGKVAAGATLELQPAGLTCKVREVQSHGAAVQGVGTSQRAALNLTGLDRQQIERGMELATPGYLTGSRYVDARVQILSRLEKPFISHRRVRVSLGTSEGFAMPVVIGRSQIEPGADALVQLHFSKPVVASFGQPFILRSESAQATIGGGRVLRPVSRRFRVNHPDELEALLQAESEDPFVRHDQAVRRAGFEPPTAVRMACETGVEPDDVPTLTEMLDQEDALISVAGNKVHRATVEALERRALAYLKRHHLNNPTEPGVPRDRFIGWISKRSSTACGKQVFGRLQDAGKIQIRGPYVAHHEFGPTLSPEDAALLEQLVAEIAAAGFDPPAMSALNAAAKLSKPRAKMLNDLAKCDARLESLAPGHYISAQAVEQLKQTVSQLGKDRPFKLADVRDALKLSRRAVQPMLEYLDRIQFTKRVGDERVLQ